MAAGSLAYTDASGKLCPRSSSTISRQGTSKAAALRDVVSFTVNSFISKYGFYRKHEHEAPDEWVAQISLLRPGFFPQTCCTGCRKARFLKGTGFSPYVTTFELTRL